MNSSSFLHEIFGGCKNRGSSRKGLRLDLYILYSLYLMILRKDDETARYEHTGKYSQ